MNLQVGSLPAPVLRGRGNVAERNRCSPTWLSDAPILKGLGFRALGLGFKGLGFRAPFLRV